MKNTLFGFIALLLLGSSLANAQKTKEFDIKSQDGNIALHVTAGQKLQWSVQLKGKQIIAPSAISLQLENGESLGDNASIKTVSPVKVNTVIKALNYKKTIIQDVYSELTLTCKKDFGVIFRVYNDGVAYRFFTRRKGEIVVKNEEANFNFTNDYKAFIPYMWDYREGKIFNSSFEALYKETNISKFAADSLAFLPLLVDEGDNTKVVILEADLEDYPGMYLDLNETHKGFKGVYSPYPLETKMGGYNNLNVIPTKRAGYIAKTSGTRSFPWRAVVISQSDKELLNNDMVQKLASPSRLADASWVKPGQAAWDWWNNWNITHVDFKAGINTQTYKYYIDFASANKIGYIILDEGWSVGTDLSRISPAIDLKEIVDYGKLKHVDVILWATWSAVAEQMDKIFPLYSKMGVRGFKIDFFDRDDQVVVASTYAIAQKAAEYHLMVDYHGIYKPTGLQKTYPNVIGFEGVKGMENYKWATEDQPRYTVSIPFIRMMAGPMDYTPGAMRNAIKSNYHSVATAPMSMGTRCNQLAMYVLYEAPFQMLADNPTIYMKEQECTDFITGVPTTTDETIALDGKVGEFAAVARRKGDTWFVGAMTNWNARELTLDFAFLPQGKYQAVIFRDGVNADRDATDYKKENITITSSDKINVQLAPGGGWAARIEKINQYTSLNQVSIPLTIAKQSGVIKYF